MLIPFEEEQEAHYVCALANSSLFRFAVAAYSINIQQDPHVFQNVRIPKYENSDPAHRRLAQLARRAHEVAHEGEPGELSKIEVQIDQEAARVWGLSEQELRAMKT